ncbi:hypothetical protein [Moraxella lacunata]
MPLQPKKWHNNQSSTILNWHSSKNTICKSNSFGLSFLVLFFKK